ncbi:hypothetical protein [Sulfurimonas sp. HSL3-7]|uniref:hypothetical protein n=1 Tax=Sulfonitrofixus jiaomeiensis TaxID=3131938 RepID=UPI0031F790E9
MKNIILIIVFVLFFESQSKSELLGFNYECLHVGTNGITQKYKEVYEGETVHLFIGSEEGKNVGEKKYFFNGSELKLINKKPNAYEYDAKMHTSDHKIAYVTNYSYDSFPQDFRINIVEEGLLYDSVEYYNCSRKKEIDLDNFFKQLKSNTLPFIGKATFNFSGGNGTQEYIEIKGNSDIDLGNCGVFGCSSYYTGKYESVIENYSFIADAVLWVDETGKIRNKCDEWGVESDKNLPCKQKLSFNYRVDTKTGEVYINQDIFDSYAYQILGDEYETSSEGKILWKTSDLVQKRDNHSQKIYCIKNKNICTSEKEIVDSFKKEKGLSNKLDYKIK